MDKKTKIYLILAVLISLPAILPLLHGGYFPVHDNLQVERIYEMAQALMDGQFPVRWVGDLGYGYGYPLFNFYSPLPYYIGAFFNIAGFSLVISAKLMFGIGIMLSGITMYLLGKEIWGKWGGIISAILYVYLPYHAVQIYVRGAVGEYYAYAFLPLLVLSLLNIYKTPVKSWFIIGSFAYTGIILSHNISAMLITMGVLSYLFIYSSTMKLKNKYQISNIKYQIYILLLGLGLSAFFWLPAIYESGYIQVNKVIAGGSYFADHFVEPLQLWNSPWGYAGSAPMGEQDGMSFKLGKVHIILALISSVLVLYRRKRKHYPLLIALYLLLSISIFMMLPISKPVWDLLSPMKFVQFPWRFLMYSGFALSVIAGGVGLIVQRYRLGMLLAVFVFILVIINIRILPRLEIQYFKPSEYFQLDDSVITSDNNLRWIKSKKSDEYLPKYFFQPKIEEEISVNRVDSNVHIIKDKADYLSFEIEVDKETELPVYIAYFQGWKGYIDGKEVPVKRLTRGISITIPTGTHNVMIRLENTPIRWLGNMVSLASIGVLFILLNRYVRP